jgi:hypothetical protein
MKYLTFLDYTTLEATGKNIEAKLSEKDKEMQAIKERHEQEIKYMHEEIISMQESQKEILNLFKDPSKLLGVLKKN